MRTALIRGERKVKPKPVWLLPGACLSKAATAARWRPQLPHPSLLLSHFQLYPMPLGTWTSTVVTCSVLLSEVGLSNSIKLPLVCSS